MKGRVCVVTGANRGIGKSTALGLAGLGATVVMICRDAALGEAARREIRERAGNDLVDCLQADLSSLESIESVAREIGRRHDRLHVLINNAGVFRSACLLTAEGRETTFAVNHLGVFRLTRGLIGQLRESAPSRVIITSSQAHRQARLDPEDLDMQRSFNGMIAYCNSKLENLLFSYELSRRLEGSGVCVNAIHPGSIRTRLVEEDLLGMSALTRLARPLCVPFLRTPETGARTGILLASSPDLEGVTGRYYKLEREARSSRVSHDRELAGRLWEISEDLSRPR